MLASFRYVEVRENVRSSAEMFTRKYGSIYLKVRSLSLLVRRPAPYQFVSIGL